jgi:hypothetical protein
MRNGARELDVAHALTANLGLNNLYSALLAHNAPVTEALVLTADTLVILNGSEDLSAEETVALRLERSVVDRLRLGDFTKGPATDLIRAR